MAASTAPLPTSSNDFSKPEVTPTTIVYQKGAIIHSAVVPIGGDHFTNDIAVGLRTPIPDAEKIKRR